jgi:hypothetical protein
MFIESVKLNKSKQINETNIGIIKHYKNII